MHRHSHNRKHRSTLCTRQCRLRKFCTQMGTIHRHRSLHTRARDIQLIHHLVHYLLQLLGKHQQNLPCILLRKHYTENCHMKGSFQTEVSNERKPHNTYHIRKRTSRIDHCHIILRNNCLHGIQDLHRKRKNSTNTLYLIPNSPNDTRYI